MNDDDKKVCIELTRGEDDCILYSAFIECGEEFRMIGSGEGANLAAIFQILHSLTERTL